MKETTTFSRISSLISRILAHRFQGIFEWGYYGYPIRPRGTPEERQKKQEKFFNEPTEACLFLPCTSAYYMSNLLGEAQRYLCLQELLRQEQMSTLLVPISPVAQINRKASALPKPITAYEPGHKRECSYVQVAQAIEQRLVRRMKELHTPAPKEPPHTLLIEARKPLIRFLTAG